MKIVSVANKKGGVGKSLLAASLTVAGAHDGLNVALIDLDPQASCCTWADAREADTDMSEIPTFPVVSVVPNRLSKTLDQCRDNELDLVVIDTSPSADSGLLAAARAADLVLLPTRPGLGDLAALRDSLAILKTVEATLFAVLNAAKTDSLKTEGKAAITSLGLEICPVSLGDRIDFQHGFSGGWGATEFRPKNKASGEMQRLWRWVKKTLDIKPTEN